ncbi:MAG: hypothetical protein OEZ39_02140 [Gammaproteobacteria bacterium]|nr:hypothetical protein [Gammaproteobacteria bacterium]MDH5650654.1 hypothetical protein [Gammaproteobacteria bacterium]
MRKPERPELIPGDKAVRQHLLIMLALYILLLIQLEPIIDWLLLLPFLNPDPLDLVSLNQRKLEAAAVTYALARVIPVSLFFWLGYRIVTSARLPPARMKFPFTVPLIKGKQAKMFGLLLITISLILIYLEMVWLTRTIIS